MLHHRLYAHLAKAPHNGACMCVALHLGQTLQWPILGMQKIMLTLYVWPAMASRPVPCYGPKWCFFSTVAIATSGAAKLVLQPVLPAHKS